MQEHPSRQVKPTWKQKTTGIRPMQVFEFLKFSLGVDALNVNEIIYFRCLGKNVIRPRAIHSRLR
jgi:hypothetical protein